MVNENVGNFLWSTKFPDECKQLPYDYLTTEEQQIVDKCKNKDSLTDNEKDTIKNLLYRYRPFFNKYNENRLEENIETSQNVVTTQSKILGIIHDPKRYRIDMNHWVNGEKFLLKMQIKPYTDKQYLEGLGTQMSLFRDLKREEKKVIAKAETNQPMTPEEVNMHNNILDKLNEKVYNEEYNIKIINEFLADRISFIDDDEDLTFEDKLKFWEVFDLNPKTALFHEVRGRLHLNDTFEEELFPPIG